MKSEDLNIVYDDISEEEDEFDDYIFAELLDDVKQKKKFFSKSHFFFLSVEG